MSIGHRVGATDPESGGGRSPGRPVRPARRRAQRLDWVLLAAALTLSVLGVALVWSVTAATAAAPVQRQVLSLVMGMALALLVALLDPRMLRVWALPVYLAALGLLALTFSPLGVEVAGARAWLALPGGFTIQPSELAKLALIVAVSSLVAGHGSLRARASGGGDFARAVLAAIPAIVIVVLQRDMGTALVMVAIVVTILVIAGARRRWLLALAVAGAAVAMAALRLGLIAPYQLQRLTSFLHPTADPLGAGHNVIQSKIAIQNGGLLGHGLSAGPQTQGRFVPVSDSDFIFTVAAEELGFVGAALVIGLLTIILVRGIRIALTAGTLFSRCVAAGVVAWFAFQGFENIGMTLGLLPVTGVTLPFVSYGGSSLMAAWLGIGLLQLVRLTAHPAR